MWSQISIGHDVLDGDLVRQQEIADQAPTALPEKPLGALVDKLEPNALKPLGRALQPLSLTRSTNYAWLYGIVCLSPTIEGSVAKLEGKLVDGAGKVRKSSAGSKKSQDGFTLWTGSWEMFDLPPGVYTLELTATDKAGARITSRTEKVLHGNPASK